MIEYVNITNIDTRIITRAKRILENGGLVAYPTDTSWGIGCSIKSEKGITKLRKLKGDFQNYTLTMICSNISQISEFVQLSNINFKIVNKYIPGPYVFILPAKLKVEKIINMKRLEIGVRIPDNPVPIRIIESLEFPIFSITASKNMTSRGWWDSSYAEENLFEHSWELEDIPDIDLILDAGDVLPKVLSTVINLTNEELEIIRQGIGVV